MNPEERFERIERLLNFLATNQASHDGKIAENSKQIAENSKQIAENSTQIAQNTEQIRQLADLTLRIGRIMEQQASRMDALAESQRNTGQRLNALINVVERYFSNGHR
jgi:methyl-accepting chemotaxis protein